jgi:hypothetical protein
MRIGDISKSISHELCGPDAEDNLHTAGVPEHIKVLASARAKGGDVLALTMAMHSPLLKQTASATKIIS